eukprot:2924847-Prymnesium_polylepis.1
MLAAGRSIRLIPMDSPATHSCCPYALIALCVLTSEAEHAVSMATHGPCRPSAKDTLPAETA